MSYLKNILEDISSKGINGDNTLRKVNGELSHVNPVEADLIDTYGLIGEQITKDIGSGTINPNTGLKEYHRQWWPHGHGDMNMQLQDLPNILGHYFGYQGHGLKIGDYSGPNYKSGGAPPEVFKSSCNCCSCDCN